MTADDKPRREGDGKRRQTLEIVTNMVVVVVLVVVVLVVALLVIDFNTRELRRRRIRPICVPRSQLIDSELFCPLAANLTIIARTFAPRRGERISEFSSPAVGVSF